MASPLYSIVKFKGEYDLNGRSVIDIVPSIWIRKLNDSSNHYECWYPDTTSMDTIVDLTRSLHEPDNTSIYYGVEILTTAVNYDQGIRRLDRACKSLDEELCSGDSNLDDYSSTYGIFKTKTTILNQSESMKNNDIQIIYESDEDKINNNNKNKSVHQPTPRIIIKKNKKVEEYRMRLKTLKSSLLRENNDDGTMNFIADYMEEAFTDLFTCITNELTHVKRSLQYDIKSKTDDIISSSFVNPVQGPPPQEILGIKLPIETLVDFEIFEDSLDLARAKTDDAQQLCVQKRNALMSLFSNVSCSSEDPKKNIQTIIQAVIKKPVQLLYSGTGRITNGVKKLSFNTTQTFIFMTEFLHAKYPGVQIKILTITSDFLSGAKDRDGGYKQRKISQ